jgi:ribonuclease-3
LVHRSYLNENPESRLSSNERLEFLGDAILDFVAGEFLFRHSPDQGEGELTQLRSALVRTETLSNLAKRIGLGQHVVLGRGEDLDGGRGRATILADLFEALVGAIYLDAGMEQVRTFLLPLLEGELGRLDGQPPMDAKSALQIELQGQMGLTPHYRTVTSWGPDHARTFRVEVLLGETVLGVGEGPNKQAAQQSAAAAALEHLRGEETG